MTQTVFGKSDKRWKLPSNDDSSKGSIEYGGVQALLHSNTTSGPKWSKSSASPYLNYKNSKGEAHQVWYDDPKSLYIKYNYAIKAGVRGIGMWTADFPDYVDYPKGSAAMWKCVNDVVSKTQPHRSYF